MNCTTYVTEEGQLHQQFQSRRKSSSVQACRGYALRIRRRTILNRLGWSGSWKEGRGFLKEVLAKMSLEGHLGARRRNDGGGGAGGGDGQETEGTDHRKA